MADTAFTDLVTLTDDDWFNDVNRLHYTIFGDPATSSAAFSNIKQPATDTSTGVVEYAVQSEMETASSNALVVPPGRQHFHPGHPKAVGRVSGTTTLAFSYPATGASVSYTTTGSFVLTPGVTFSSSTAWGALIEPIGPSLIHSVSTFTVSTVSLRFIDNAGAAADPDGFIYTVYGDI